MDWQSLATLFAVLCPSFLLVGLILGAAVALYFFRAMGARWPWEQRQEQGREQERGNHPMVHGPHVGDTFTIFRVPADSVAGSTARMVRNGWLHVNDGIADSTNLRDLHFVWVGEGR